MQLQIESTDEITSMENVPVRVWRGGTESGVPCIVFIHRIAVLNSEDQSQFERELAEQLPPGRFVPFRNIL
jgi:hypothetical protein